MKSRKRMMNALGAVGVAGLVVGAFLAGRAYAADQRLFQSAGHVNQAIVLLEAAENPGVNPPFDGHRTRTIRLLRRAQTQIDEGAAFADGESPSSSGDQPFEAFFDFIDLLSLWLERFWR